jgi:hypothetical protein
MFRLSGADHIRERSHLTRVACELITDRPPADFASVLDRVWEPGDGYRRRLGEITGSGSRERLLSGGECSDRPQEPAGKGRKQPAHQLLRHPRSRQCVTRCSTEDRPKEETGACPVRMRISYEAVGFRVVGPN